MHALLNNLLNDEAGFLVSAELVMIATLGILAMAVGLSEVAFNINSELQDVGRAFGSMNQSFHINGQSNAWGGNGNSSFTDTTNLGSDIQAGSQINGEN